IIQRKLPPLHPHEARCLVDLSMVTTAQPAPNEATAQTHTTVNTNRHKSAANRNGHNRSQPQAKQAAQSRTTVNANRHKFAANRNGHKRSYRSKATHNMASRNSSSPPPQQAEYALSKACFNQATL
ncbi:MAG: hypothetical protein K2N21_05555, partial [Rikenellaceae bacterium]|nr:hypothetical protein [Rikenellaceae bacterium]